MKNRRVGSREYKIMLDATMFSTHPEHHLACVNRFWTDFCALIDAMGIRAANVLEVLLQERLIRFYDTKDNRLHNNAYLFRERIALASDKREVTLKYRHPDRYLAQDRNIAGRAQKGGETKFEQDIKAPYLTLYSYSSKQAISKNKKLNRMNDPGRLFPGLAPSLERYESNRKLILVSNFEAREVVIGGAHLLLGKRQDVLTECALIFWYNTAVDTQSPALVEFSYRYKNKKERFSGYVSQQAYTLFLELQKLDTWIDSSTSSKTDYVYNLARHVVPAAGSRQVVGSGL